MIDYSASLRVGYTCPDLLNLPLLGIQIRLYRLAEKIGAIAVERTGKFIEGQYFVGCKPETNSLLFHNPV